MKQSKEENTSHFNKFSTFKSVTMESWFSVKDTCMEVTTHIKSFHNIDLFLTDIEALCTSLLSSEENIDCVTIWRELSSSSQKRK